MSELDIEAAWTLLDAACVVLPAEDLPLTLALNRVTAEPVRALCDLPPFRQSGFDGYALRTASVAQWPVHLPLGKPVAAGPVSVTPVLAAGQACRIFTGAMIPDGADAVVRQEWVRREAEGVSFSRPVAIGQDIRQQGEEVLAGDILLPAGQRLDAGRIAMLAAAGVARVSVHAAPRITVLISGDEIVGSGKPLRPGEVYDANGPLIASWLLRNGQPMPHLERMVDREDIVRAMLLRAFEVSDLVLSVGGVSVGDRDFIVPQAEHLGAERVFWKVSQKPGKPLYVARRGASLLMGLPGNPASVLVNLAAFVSRALDLLQGAPLESPRVQNGILAAPAECDSERETWLRVSSSTDANGRMVLQPLPKQSSHMISNLASADMLARLPRMSGQMPAGAVVQCLPLRL